MTGNDIDKESLKDSTIAKLETVEDDQFAVHLPESLQNLTEEEREAAAKRGTRKIDIMLIPACRCHPTARTDQSDVAVLAQLP